MSKHSITLEEKASEVIRRLKKVYGSGFRTALNWRSDWQLLIAVILSAQTTDENVNKVTEVLFKRFTSPKQIADADISDLEKVVYSTGYYRSKARNIKACCDHLVNDFNGRVPDNMNDLIKLPGVGRKTANVILHVLFGKAEGIVMDTHITRVTQRIGFIDKKDPLLGEAVMKSLLKPDLWGLWGDLLIQHGRKVCHARNPSCDKCVLNDLCDFAKKINAL